MKQPNHVVIVGGGFAGLEAALSLRGADVQITLLDRRNFHLFQPLLYQVATGALSPANISAPLRAVLARQRNVTVLLAEVVDVDAAARKVILADGDLGYDTLIVAAGARHHYFGKEQWEAMAPGLKTIEDATEIRKRILLAFETAERLERVEDRKPWLTFAVVGGGATGVELAGALGEIAHHTLKKDFRRIDPEEARVVLVEGGDRVLSGFAPDLSARARKTLEGLGVEVLTGSTVEDVTAESLTIRSGEARRTIALRTVLWAAGVSGSPLGAAIARATGAELDRAGRVVVEKDLTVKGHPEIFVLGDLANVKDAAGKPLPGVCPVAMQQGRYAARLVRSRLRGAAPPAAFRYWDKGSMATIGRNAAVADMGFARFGGYLAWLAWLFIHIMYLVQFQNRLLVLMQWAWSYLTWNRAARLITFGWQPAWKASPGAVRPLDPRP